MTPVTNYTLIGALLGGLGGFAVFLVTALVALVFGIILGRV